MYVSFSGSRCIEVNENNFWSLDSRGVTPNVDFKSTPLFVENLRNGSTQTHGYYRPLIESDVRLIELWHRQ